jgi:cytochrome c-type biogenesis protein CcmF
MSAEIGQLALILAFMLGLVQGVAPMVGAHRGDKVLMSLGRASALLQMAFVVLAFGALATAYVTMDFSVELVAKHSHSTQPLPYRFAASWGSHEGSMLLWVLILALHGGAIAFFGRSLRETLQARVLAVQGLLSAAFIGFSLFTSNPFLRLSPIPLDGTELNPLLQDPGLVMHPPLLYLGYVGFSVAFSFAVAALIEGRVDAAWARWVRPWVLSAWVSLTIGIALGSWWAYYELGWGGWWFWDPVENASLMPWLMGTALLHSAMVLEKRGALISWTILLSVLTFSLSMIGTFLVRSGVLTSVHAFAVDPERGAYILVFILIATGAALALYAWRAPAMRTGALFSPLSREAGVTLNNLFLLAATATVFLGTFYPVFIDVLNGDKISVGPPYYNMTFVPLFIPLLVLVAFGPVLNWKRDTARAALMRLRWPVLITIVVAGLGAVVFGLAKLGAALGIALGVWLVAASLMLLIRRWGIGRKGAETARLIRTTPLAVWGVAIAHAGLGVSTIGITAITAWTASEVVTMVPGQTIEFAGRRITLDALGPATGPNYQAEQGRFRIEGQGRPFLMVSEKRFYPSSQSQTTEAGIHGEAMGNLYISVGESATPGAATVRLWWHPLVGWIWGGAMIMALGGALSLSDRRLRLAMPARKTAPAKTGEATA